MLHGLKVGGRGRCRLRLGIHEAPSSPNTPLHFLLPSVPAHICGAMGTLQAEKKRHCLCGNLSGQRDWGVGVRPGL